MLRVINHQSQTSPGDIRWRNHYSWILVGGKALDRGFTLEGLTVSYISRGVGAGFADVIQQRGRFFGYKKEYLGYCRVYLPQASLDAFIDYVEHEESLRSELQKAIVGGESIKQWRRTFLLSPRLTACRQAVVENFTRGKFGAKWVRPNYKPSDGSVISANREMIKAFLNNRSQSQYRQVSKSDSARDIYRVSSPPTLKEIREKLLVDYKISNSQDAAIFIGAIFQIGGYIEKCHTGATEKCDVFIMNKEKNRIRTVDELGKFALFQGRSPETGDYPGDGKIIEHTDNVAVQIHYLDLNNEDGETIHSNVPMLALWIPKKLSKQSLLVQIPQEDD